MAGADVGVTIAMPSAMPARTTLGGKYADLLIALGDAHRAASAKSTTAATETSHLMESAYSRRRGFQGVL